MANENPQRISIGAIAGHGSQTILKRHPKNPIITPEAVPGSNGILNSAVIKYGDEYRGVFRVDDHTLNMNLHAGRSKNAIDWEIDPKPIDWKRDPSVPPFEYGYDPRVVFLDGRYYIVWCHCHHGYSIGLGVTDDFETFEFLDIILPPYNRNAVLFPRKINGEYVMLHRPSDSAHTPFGDIHISKSKDLIYWGKHRHVMGPRDGWQSTKVGAGPVPIETPEGWLMIYHGVITTCNGCVYHAGAALLDLDDPSKVIHRAHPYILHPSEPYERVGYVNNVVFPCAALHDEKTDELTVYYGGADTYVCAASCKLADLVEFVKENRFND